MNQTPLRALICEDEGLAVMQLRKALTQAGYQVVGEAIEGSEAIALYKQHQPDFILMDINLPGMDGISATRAIFQEKPVPIIMLTAYSDEQWVDSAMDAGACAYLVKPLIGEQLIPTIRAALNRFQAFETAMRETNDLKEALEVRKIVERAKGILMERKSLSEADAYKKMQKTSRDRCQTMKKTALEIISADEIFS